MAIIGKVVRHVSHALATSIVEIAARQAAVTTGTASLAISATATGGSSTPDSTIASPSLLESPSASSQPTDTPGDDGTDDGGSNSPLLFFVALGFGVVFTNLW